MAPRKPRVPMPASQRAKQFAPFDALKGLKEAIAAKERQPTPRKELTEERILQINDILSKLQRGQQVTVIYYDSVEQEYLQITGSVQKVDGYWKSLQIDRTVIAFRDIYNIIE